MARQRKFHLPKGVHHVAKPNGKDYFYAYKGGPPLKGRPGTTEFYQSYLDALAGKGTSPR